ncbi:GNAT family N-acetyltransferase [Salirhabdus sp. Marseille-P4669]|uniref:GNAT family N-acetyltransferase n=1 Tax=Salirhabdus sp. Marseille-P4669 TaxID=2042310 RepID=UPI000C7D99F5|nr:GNAT family N-acetyltransferase [Salirhabdus sp. Marseille-P4669]
MVEQHKRDYLYEKVKWIKGYDFITIENTKELSEEEVLLFLKCLREDTSMRKYNNVHILIDDKFSNQVDQELLSQAFVLHDETVMVYKDLEHLSNDPLHFQYKSLYELKRDMFVTMWENCMYQSWNASSSLNVEGQMKSVEVELGQHYKRSCLVAFEKDNPIGVILPHIEPGTIEEGRLFYFGILQTERGKGKSKQLHQDALQLLKNTFKATYYIGSTSRKNIPMLKTFENNGCKVVERNRYYKKKFRTQF